MKRILLLCILFIALIVLVEAISTSQPALGVPISVVTSRYNNARTGANLNEALLNAANVNARQFGKLFTRSVVGDIYAQPLYVPGVTIPGQGVHNVVYTATMHNNVYAFDADNLTASAPLWQVNLGPSFTDSAVIFTGDIWGGEDGVLSTPVIDLTTQTMYLTSHTTVSGVTSHRLHALDITTGQEKFGGPVTIQGSASGSTFNSYWHLQRPGLLLLNGNIYLAFASSNDRGSYHGWVMAYSASTLQQTAIWVVSSYQGGIWQSGSGLTSDGASIYTITANGGFDASTGGPNYANSFVKLSPSLQVQDYFSPYDQQALSDQDLDLGASGVSLIPGNGMLLAAGGGKDGKLYLLNTANMGHFNASNNNNAVQVLQATRGHMHNTPVYWNGPAGATIYAWTEQDYPKAFHLGSNNQLDTVPVSTGETSTTGMPAGILSLSANGSTAGTGILWGTYTPPNVRDGVLIAFDANDLTRELWTSEDNPSRDRYGIISKFSPVTVANGKVYAGSFSNRLNVYGLLPGGQNDTIGVYRPSAKAFYLRNSNTTGPADIITGFGASTDLPVAGDWNGDGIDTVGVYRPSTGQYFLSNSTTNPATVSYSFTFGSPGDQPIVGDWLGNGFDGVGVFRPTNGLIYLRNTLSSGYADYTMVLGVPGDKPIAGDWNTDGVDTPGVYRPSKATFYLTNRLCNCGVYADYTTTLGVAGDQPFAGDWNGDSRSGIGVYRPSNGLIYLKNNPQTTGYADITLVFGSPNDKPVAGHWSMNTGASPQQAPALVTPFFVPATQPATQSAPKLAPTFVP
ncbi:MAG: hypothetical protein ABI947_27650 [Chloroflexota bacterium]